MRIISHARFWIGIGLLFFFFLAYFVPIPVDSGSNYYVLDTLLGILIFHNAFILGFYILVAAILGVSGIRFTTYTMKGGKKNESGIND